MIRERIADDIYVFTSQRYAHVTAGAILTREGAVLIDTLFYPDETAALKSFLESRLGYQVRYVVNTHYHADHTQGTYQFSNATVISHALCRQLLDTIGREGLARSQAQSNDLDDVAIVLPNLIYEAGRLKLHVGGKSIIITHMPGHSPDLSAVFVVEDGILFAADNMMPVPTFFDGDFDDLVTSLEAIADLHPDIVVQGHGEVVLRGELESVIASDIAYLNCVRDRVAAWLEAGREDSDLAAITIEDCGKSRVPLNGLVAELHQANVTRLAQAMAEAAAKVT